MPSSSLSESSSAKSPTGASAKRRTEWTCLAYQLPWCCFPSSERSEGGQKSDVCVISPICLYGRVRDLMSGGISTPQGRGVSSKSASFSHLFVDYIRMNGPARVRRREELNTVPKLHQQANHISPCPSKVISFLGVAPFICVASVSRSSDCGETSDFMTSWRNKFIRLGQQ